MISVAAPSWVAAITPDLLPKGDTEHEWQGRQFVAADRAGHVFLLRAETLDVFPLTRSGMLGEPVRLGTHSGSNPEVRGAALSPAGDAWLLRVPKGVRWFEHGKEKVVAPLAWAPFAVTFRRGTPVAAVAPLPVRPLLDAKKVGPLPWLQQLDGDEWSLIREREGPSLAEMMKVENWFGRILEEDPLFMTSDHRGRLWVANRYAYRVRQLSASGRVLAEILGEQGKVRKKQDSKPIEIKPKALANPSEATRAPAQEKGTFYPFTAQAVIQGLIEGPDRRMYFLVVPKDGGAALDRFDPVRGVVERASLQWQAEGEISLAAGKDALYLAPQESTKGRWRIPWDDLEAASWKTIPGIEVSGMVDEPPVAGSDPAKSRPSRPK